MPISSGRLLYAGVEIKIVRGEANKWLGLDDVARCLGFEAADEVSLPPKNESLAER
jgi:hypothetical protein